MKKKYHRKSPAIIKAAKKKDDLLKMPLEVDLCYWMWALKLKHMIKLHGKTSDELQFLPLLCYFISETKMIGGEKNPKLFYTSEQLEYFIF